jgi:hypothetical protein
MVFKNPLKSMLGLQDKPELATNLNLRSTRCIERATKIKTEADTVSNDLLKRLSQKEAINE